MDQNSLRRAAGRVAGFPCVLRTHACVLCLFAVWMPHAVKAAEPSPPAALVEDLHDEAIRFLTFDLPDQDTDENTEDPLPSAINLDLDADAIDDSADEDVKKTDPADSLATVPLPPRRPVPRIEKEDFGYQTGMRPVPPVKPMKEQHAPLSKEDSARYRKIFDLQESGLWEEADSLITELTDFRLRGHVLFQRYMHPTAYVAHFEELEGWLSLYADHPDPDRVYGLALRRAPTQTDKDSLSRPDRVLEISGRLDLEAENSKPYVSNAPRTAAQSRAVHALMRTVRTQSVRGAPDKALESLGNAPARSWADDVEYDLMRSHIAAGYLRSGDLDKAMLHARTGLARSGGYVPLAGWVAGMVSWRRGAFAEAAGYFESAASSPYANGWTISAAAYWASRAHMRTGNVRQVSRWLTRATDFPRTFYGLIATRALGRVFAFNWETPPLTPTHISRIKKIPSGARASLLVQAGQIHLAESELRQIHPKTDSALADALIAYAVAEKLPSFAMQLAGAVPNPRGGLYDGALYPLSPWTPDKGYAVDKALVHAIIRQESRFDPRAESRRGASGLMQIMPATASYIGNTPFHGAAGRHQLKNPDVNLLLGQTYILHLLQNPHVQGDLVSLAIAYNAGPGNLARWKEAFDFQDDPLLFIESIPFGETRAYVKHVLANYWIYRMRLGHPTPSLDSIAGGGWARYARLD